jgi:hypothetical protein
MSKKDMLGSSALALAAGPLKTLIDRLDGPNGEAELAALNRYLRKENPWPSLRPKSSSHRGPRHIIDCSRSIKAQNLSFDCEENGSCVDVLVHVAKHCKQVPGCVRGQIAFDPNRLHLYLLGEGESIIGKTMQSRLSGKSVLPYQVLEFMLDHPELVPDEFRSGDAIHFWGTIFEDDEENLYVPYIYWNDYVFDDGLTSIQAMWTLNMPAAILAGE